LRNALDYLFTDGFDFSAHADFAAALLAYACLSALLRHALFRFAIASISSFSSILPELVAAC